MKPNADRLNRAVWFRKFKDRPFEEYLVACYSGQETLQKQSPRSPLYWFTWLVKGHDDMTEQLENPMKAIEIVESNLSGWSRQQRKAGKPTPFKSKSRDPWEEWFDAVREDATATFFETWKKIRFRPGMAPLQQAFQENQHCRLHLHSEIRKRRPGTPGERSTRDYEFFVGLATYLQVAMGTRPILLPVDDVGELMGIRPSTVSLYRKWAMEDGYLIEESQYVAHKKATEFHAKPSCWPQLRLRLSRGPGGPYSEPCWSIPQEVWGADEEWDGVEENTFVRHENGVMGWVKEIDGKWAIVEDAKCHKYKLERRLLKLDVVGD
jgi:hypothetical protein